MSFISRIRKWIAPKRKQVNARFDAARITTENQRHLAMADGMSARAAYSPEVRNRLRRASRLEAENCSWYSGMIRTAANHIVGNGPTLQVTTPNKEFNARLEKHWAKWSRAVRFAQKLQEIVQTDWRDGEAFAMRISRPALYPISLDIRTYEADQVSAPFIGTSLNDASLEDGIRIDSATNEIEYWIYDHHPGDTAHVPTLKGDWYPAREVIHHYRSERPGQVRGVPRGAPALPLMPVMRRHTLATLFAAESAANIAGLLQTNSSAITPAAIQGDFQLVDLPRNALLQVPEGWSLGQIHAENPNSNHAMFQMQTMMEVCRCMNMPYGLAAGTSKDSNFSSFKGDVKNTWQPEVRSEQHRLELDVVERVFQWFLEDAIFADGLLDGAPQISEIDHQWVWPPLPTLDEIASANAAAIRISTGQSSLSHEHAERQQDYETEVARMANDFGVDVPKMKQMLAHKTFAASGEAKTPLTNPEAANAVGGEYTEIGQRAFNNNLKRIRQTLEGFVNNEISQVMAEQTLQSIGLNPERIDALLVDAMDGTISDPELQEVTT